MPPPNTANWIRLGLLALPVYGLLTFWTTLDPQPDSSTDYEAWAEGQAMTFERAVVYALEEGNGTAYDTVDD